MGREGTRQGGRRRSFDAVAGEAAILTIPYSLTPTPCSLLKDRGDDFFDAALHFGVVGERPDDAHLAGAAGGDALGDQLAGVDQQPGADPFAEAVLTQVADLFAQLRQLQRRRRVDARLLLDDLRLDLARRIGEVDRDEALARAVLQVFQRTLVAGVVG